MKRYDVPEIVEDVVLLDFTDIEKAFYKEIEGKEGFFYISFSFYCDI